MVYKKYKIIEMPLIFLINVNVNNYNFLESNMEIKNKIFLPYIIIYKKL